MMKILIITPYIGSSYGGTSRAVTELVKGLVTLGIGIDLITTNANHLNRLDVIIDTWIVRKNHRIKYFPCWYHNDFIVSPALINWLFKNVKNYNLVHTHTIFSPLMSLSHWACKYNKIPYVMTPHGMLEPWALSYKASKKYFYYSMFEKSALQKATAVQVLASSEAQQLQSLGFQHSVVVPNGIHRSEFATLPKPEIFYQKYPETREKKLILFLGRIDPKKGLNLLAPAFAKVKNQFPQTHLIVAGPDNIGFLATVKNYFKQVGCLDSVTFTGMLQGSIKQAALAAANLYVAPSYSEGFSMSVLEGMASELPCVITTGCNFPEAATAKAVSEVDINSDAIADALIEFLVNPQKAKKIGERARYFIFQNYTWEKAAKKLSQVYNNILLEQEAHELCLP
ncbi:MAG: glycosyltransferase [Cyanobacteria bacterium J06621_15]